MDLFSYQQEQELAQNGPLASRMRPRHLDEMVGQSHILGKGKLLRRAIQADQLSSLILYGPPGTGKTTLAHVIADSTRAQFVSCNAITSGVSELRKIGEEAKQRLGMYQQRTVLFVDEIHRFNRAQQDALLPDVENGTLILIGATTENPSYEVNAALLSRSLLFPLYPLSPEEMKTILLRALEDEERGLGTYDVEWEEKALQHLIQVAGGDSRQALNALELAVITTDPDPDGKRRITLSIAEESIQQKQVRYDKKGDNHYDTISAFIKSMRGSDPDAALYYLAKMLVAGEDPRFIARRILIHAAEDVGLADPRALMVASAAAQAVDWVGLPEARIPLAEATLYLATAPKSNSAYRGIHEAIEAVKQEYQAEVPPHLRQGGSGYLYPHDQTYGYIPQKYLPTEHQGKTFYHPKPVGYEKKLQEFQQWLKQSTKTSSPRSHE